MNTLNNVRREIADDMQFSTMQSDAGQIVKIGYAMSLDADGNGWLVRKTSDAADGSISFDARKLKIDESAFAPQNGILPNCVGEWLNISRVDACEYRIAFPMESGEWDVVETFTAESDDAANEYAEENYSDKEWFVLNATGKNINGGE